MFRFWRRQSHYRRPNSNGVGAPRHLTPLERDLIVVLLDSKPGNEELASGLIHAFVQDLNDSGLGSLRFLIEPNKTARFGGVLAEADFDDSDGMLVSVALNLDKEGRLYEIDMCKADSSPLLRLPAPDTIRIRPVAGSPPI